MTLAEGLIRFRLAEYIIRVLGMGAFDLPWFTTPPTLYFGRPEPAPVSETIFAAAILRLPPPLASRIAEMDGRPGNARGFYRLRITAPSTLNVDSLARPSRVIFPNEVF